MALFPDVQREAQKAVDRVCGERLPEYSDSRNIPFVDALVRECLRWRAPVPLCTRVFSCQKAMLTRILTAVPHMVTQDDVYNGYFIPAKSIIFPNIK